MNVRVLLADPEETLVDTYRDFLTRDGFEVETAISGWDCLCKLREWRPDVLVLEPDMPDGWGDRILDEVKHNPQIRHMPVLILTRRERRMTDYPVRESHLKPFSMVELAHSIRAAGPGRPPCALSPHQHDGGMENQKSNAADDSE